MKKIDRKTFEKLEKKNGSLIISACKKLKVGETLLVDNSDYTKKSPFHQYIGSSQNGVSGALKKLKIKLSVRTLADDSGWTLTRVK
jgi:hypothetical protein